MKEVALNILLYIHIVTGTSALLTGAVALLAQKGNKIHRKAGLIFFYSMLGVALSAFTISVVKNIPFLLAISVFSFYLNYSGYRALKNKAGTFTWYDWAVTVLSILTATYMIYTRTIVLLVFGILLCIVVFRNSLAQFQNEEKRKQARKKRLIAHLGNMTGTYIATVTAFLVVNVNFVKPGWLLWLLPTAVGLPFIFYQLKKHRPKV
ncbi:MAG: DUF2306 domain-containing protein [Chitinophagales bacterium]|nr:DUF2306 domain-containing protein [Chitinophagales bacterium]